jgi:hypothetical protein
VCAVSSCVQLGLPFYQVQEGARRREADSGSPVRRGELKQVVGGFDLLLTSVNLTSPHLASAPPAQPPSSDRLPVDASPRRGAPLCRPVTDALFSPFPVSSITEDAAEVVLRSLSLPSSRLLTDRLLFDQWQRLISAQDDFVASLLNEKMRLLKVAGSNGGGGATLNDGQHEQHLSEMKQYAEDLEKQLDSTRQVRTFLLALALPRSLGTDFPLGIRNSNKPRRPPGTRLICRLSRFRVFSRSRRRPRLFLATLKPRATPGAGVEALLISL